MTQVQAAAPWNDVVLWGLIASVLMDIILEAAQGLGISRMSLPFLFGTFLRQTGAGR